jgi:spore maturation protein CgeB
MNTFRKPRVCCFLDEFSYYCFLPECKELVPLHPATCFFVLKNETFDFFLCESVWNAFESGFSLGSKFPEKRRESYLLLKDIIDFLKKKGVPTVFWNKEDNLHFYFFLQYAKLFDYIFTTDKRMIEKYKKTCKQAKKIETLMFAAQPFIHNPISKKKIFLGDIFFAGKWYDFPERKKELMQLLKLPSIIKLDIYDREYDGKHSKFPFFLHKRLKKGLSYLDMIKTYKKYPFMINVNSVKNSPTMFSRRVPEALLCGTSVISFPSESIRNYFPGVYFCRNNIELLKIWNYFTTHPEHRKKNCHLSKRNILKNHTYFHRMKTICKVLSLPVPYQNNKTMVIKIYKKEKNELLEKDMREQTLSHSETSFFLNKEDVQEDVWNKLFFLISKKELKEKNISFVAFVFPGSRYGKNYLLDNVLTFQYCKCFVVGKAKNNLIKENCYVKSNQIHPHSIMVSLNGDKDVRKEIFLYICYLLQNYLEEVNETKKKINLIFYSGDCYNFVPGGKEYKNIY